MARPVIHISEEEAARSFSDLMARVEEGSEVIIERNSRAIAVLHTPEIKPRTISESMALIPERSDAVMDADFAADVQAAIDAHREPLDSSRWE